MADKKNSNKKKRGSKKAKQQHNLIGIDLCACAGGDRLKCQGPCRKRHMNSGVVECGALYHIDTAVVKKSNPSRAKKRGKEMEEERNENILGKQQRRKKRERDQT